MTNRRLEFKAAVTDRPPPVTYGPVTIRMASMALIMGGAEGVAAGRRA
jgi:hypothetical protein